MRCSLKITPLLITVFALFASTHLSAKNLVPNGDFQQGTSNWKSYHNFHKSNPVSDWSFQAKEGIAIVTGTDCQPQARVGFRSKSIQLLPKDGAYKVTVQWTGKKIHRAGLLTILSTKGSSPNRDNLEFGPSGDFQNSLTSYFAVQPEDAVSSPSLLIYLFHDGIGQLQVSEVILEEIPSLKTPYHSESPRKGPPISQVFDITESLFENQAPLDLIPRQTALSWSTGVVANLPYWTTETLKTQQANAIKLPQNQHAYLYYYGNYRYGKKDLDRTTDLQELKIIKAGGFTGVVFWDDYGLDYARWNQKKELKSDYFLTCCRLYKEAGFRSPMVFSVFAGLERGKTIIPTSQSYNDYLDVMAGIIQQGQVILGDHHKIVLQIVDEPNDMMRALVAPALATVWQEKINHPVMATVNWRTSQHLIEYNQLWVGAGDYPTYEKLSSSKITGKYCSINPSGSPVKLRYLSGLHHWASGLSTQAYWHFYSASGSPQNDLDGSKPDYLCISPEGNISQHFNALQQGLEDLILLEEFERSAIETNNQEALSFLSSLREVTNNSNALPTQWALTEDFASLRENLKKYNAP